MKVAAFGFRQGAEAMSLHAALAAAGGPGGVTHLATVTEKAASPAFREFAEDLDLPVKTVCKQELPAAHVLSRSEKSTRIWGTGSLSEAVALIAAGPDAQLTGLRVVSPDSMATCAIAFVGET